MLDEEGKLVVSNENSLLQTKYGLLLQKIFGEKQEVLQIMQTLHWDQEPYRSRKINHRRADGMLVQQTCCKRAFIRGAFMARDRSVIRINPIILKLSAIRLNRHSS